MFAKAKGILEKSSSIRDEVKQGNFDGAKELVKGQTKESTSQGDKANEVLDKSSSARDEAKQGNFNGAKEAVTQGQTTKESTGQGAAGGIAGGAVGGAVLGGASGSVAGMNKESLNKENVQETGKQISKGGIDQDKTGTSSIGQTNAEQRDIGSMKREAGQKQQASTNVTQNTGQKQQESAKANQDTGSKHDRRGSVAAGELEPNYDIRKGPITMPGTFQEKNFHNAGGAHTLVQRGVSSKGISTQEKNDNVPQVVFAGAGSGNTASSNQEKTGKAVAGGDFSKESLEKEIHEYDNLSPDIFSDGTTRKDLSKKSADQDVGKYHIDRKQLDKQGSQPSQRAGTGEAAAAAAAAAGYGTSRGVTNQSSTARKQSKRHSVSETTATRPQDLTSTSAKSNVASNVGGYGYSSGQGLAASNPANRGGLTYARAVSDQGFTPKTPTGTGYSTTASGSNQTSGLRSTTTGQTNNALFNTSATGSNQPGIAGGGVLGLHQDGSYSLSGNDNSGVNKGNIVGGAGTRQGGAYGTSSNDGFNNGIANASSSSKSSSANDMTSKRIVRQLSGSGYKVTVLQEKVQAVSHKCKTQLGLSSSQISKRSPNVDAFFDAVAAERLRWMPHDGSRLDCSLRWASRLAYAVDALRESVGGFAPAANEAASLIWGFSILLLEVS